MHWQCSWHKQIWPVKPAKRTKFAGHGLQGDPAAGIRQIQLPVPQPHDGHGNGSMKILLVPVQMVGAAT